MNNLLKTPFFLLLFMSVTLQTVQSINVIPQPFEYTTNDTACFVFNHETEIVCRQKTLIPVAEIFANTVRQSTGLDLPIVKRSKHPVYLEIDKFISHPEYYYLYVNNKAIEVYGGSTTAIYYGLQTLLQCLPPEIESPKVVYNVDWSVPEMVIEDFPQYSYRGLLIDPCRHFMPISHIKKQIDWMSKYKLNRLHLHLTDDQMWTVEIKRYPLLSRVGCVRKNADGSVYRGGFYTQEELKDLVSYAALRGVTIIPEIDMPGHTLAALAAYPQFGCKGGPYSVRSVWGVENNVLCVGNDSVFKFIENILSEVVSIFPSEYIHVGGDECPSVMWRQCPKCKDLMKKNKIKTGAKLQGYFMRKVEAILRKFDRKMIGWDEVLPSGVSTESAIMCWHDQGIATKAANKEYPVIMTPWNICYFDHYQGSKLFEPMAQGGYTDVDKIYQWNPMPSRVKSSSKNNILGAQANLWSEYIPTPEHAERMIYPRILALAENLWVQPGAKDSGSFHVRMDTALIRLEIGDVNYHVPSPEGPEAQYIEFIRSKNILLHNTFNYPMYYALDDSDRFLPFDSLLVIDKSHLFRAFSVAPTTRKHSDTISVTYKVLPDFRPSAAKDFHPGLYRQRAKGYFPNTSGLDDVSFGQPELVDSLIFNSKESYRRPWIDVYTGYMNVDSTDRYIITSDVEELWIDGILIIDNNNMVKRCNRHQALMCLEKGKHSLRVVYNNCVNDGFPAIWRKPVIKLRTLRESKFHDVSKYSFYR